MSYVLFHGHSHGGEHDTPSGPMKMVSQEEELRWQRNRTGTTLSPYKFIKRTFKRQVNSTKQLLNAGRGHQAPRKAAHCLRKEVGKKYKR